MTTRIVYLAIAIFVLMLCLAFVCIRGAQLEHRIEVLEREINALKEKGEAYDVHINSLYSSQISLCDKINHLNKSTNFTNATV